jgi:hypothetical protein
MESLARKILDLGSESAECRIQVFQQAYASLHFQLDLQELPYSFS